MATYNPSSQREAIFNVEYVVKDKFAVETTEKHDDGMVSASIVDMSLNKEPIPEAYESAIKVLCGFFKKESYGYELECKHQHYDAILFILYQSCSQ